MTTVTQPLRDEHKELIPHIEGVRSAADAVCDVSPDTLREAVDAAYDFLARHLIPHAQAEERALGLIAGPANAHYEVMVAGATAPPVACEATTRRRRTRDRNPRPRADSAR